MQAAHLRYLTSRRCCEVHEARICRRQLVSALKYRTYFLFVTSTSSRFSHHPSVRKTVLERRSRSCRLFLLANDVFAYRTRRRDDARSAQAAATSIACADCIYSPLGDPSPPAPAFPLSHSLSFFPSFAKKTRSTWPARSQVRTAPGVGVHIGGGAFCDVTRRGLPAMPLPALVGIDDFRQSNH